MKPYNHGKFADEESFAFNVFLACEEAVSTIFCKDHKRKLSIDWDYDEFGSNIYLSGYCCERFAKAVAKHLFKTQSPDNIYLVSNQNRILVHSRTRPEDTSAN